MKTTVKIMMAGLCIALAGCGKKETAGPKEKDHETLVQTEHTRPGQNPAANPENPFDHIGILHNVLLDSLRSYKERSRDTTHKGTVTYLQGYFGKEGSTRIGTGLVTRQVMDKSTGIKIIQDYHPYMLRPEFSEEAKAFTRSLMSTLDGITGPESYEGYKAAIVQTEREVLASKINVLEKRYLLTTASVLRHSGYYWMKVFSGKLIQKKGLLGFLRKVAGVITAIAADATVVGWHVIKGSDYDVLIEETVTWSEICGYYTGWYPELPY